MAPSRAMPRSASGLIHQATLVRGAHPTWGGLPYFDSSPVFKVGCASPPPTGRAPILRLASLPETLSDTPGCTSPPPGPGSTKFPDGGHPRVPVATSGPARRIYPGPRVPPGALVAPGGIYPAARPLVASSPAEAPARPMLRSARGPWVYPPDDSGASLLSPAESRGGFARPRAAEWLHPQAAWPSSPPVALGSWRPRFARPPAAVPRGGYPAGRPAGFDSRSPAAGGELALPRSAEWLHPQAGWSGGRRHLRGRSEDIQQ